MSNRCGSLLYILLYKIMMDFNRKVVSYFCGAMTILPLWFSFSMNENTYFKIHRSLFFSSHTCFLLKMFFQSLCIWGAHKSLVWYNLVLIYYCTTKVEGQGNFQLRGLRNLDTLLTAAWVQWAWFGGFGLTDIYIYLQNSNIWRVQPKKNWALE